MHLCNHYRNQDIEAFHNSRVFLHDHLLLISLPNPGPNHFTARCHYRLVLAIQEIRLVDRLETEREREREREGDRHRDLYVGIDI